MGNHNQHPNQDLARIIEIFKNSIRQAYPEVDINQIKFINTDEADFRFNNWDFFNQIKYKWRIQAENSNEVAEKILEKIPEDAQFTIRKNISPTHSYLDAFLPNSTKKPCVECDLCDLVGKPLEETDQDVPDFLSSRLVGNTDLDYLPWSWQKNGTFRADLPRDKIGKRNLLTKDIPEVLKHYKEKR